MSRPAHVGPETVPQPVPTTETTRRGRAQAATPRSSHPRAPQANTGERLHILTGAVCNNNCSFCMEDNREKRYEVNGAITPDDVRAMLEGHAGRAEVMFTSGEPTLNPNFLRYVKWSRELGYRTIGVITNGRLFSNAEFARRALKLGLNHAVVSIHGGNAALHDRQVRAPGAFAETLQGIRNLSELKHSLPLRLHTSTVVNRANFDHASLAELAELLAPLVDQLVFNVIQPMGRGDTHFERLVPRYAEIAAAFARFVARWREGHGGRAPDNVFLLDIPHCVTEPLDIPDSNRGYVEQYIQYFKGSRGGLKDRDLDTPGPAPRKTFDLEAKRREMAAYVPRSNTDVSGLATDATFMTHTRENEARLYRGKRADCATCLFDARCEGVWNVYTDHHGWDEMVPLRARLGGRGEVVG